jgi:hypothetical protein
MITTIVTAATIVTVTTVTTVTVVATILAMGLAAAVATAMVVTFGILLATKEVSGAARSPFGTRLARFMNVSVWPLAIMFGIFVVVKILEAIP